MSAFRIGAICLRKTSRLLDKHMNRVTDTCIPEEEAMRRIEKRHLEGVDGRGPKGRAILPSRVLYRILQSPELQKSFRSTERQLAFAAMEQNLPIFVPGWEDSTLGNMYAGHCISGDVKNVHTVRTGIEYMTSLAEWYTKTAKEARSVSSRSAAGSPEISRSASCRCCGKT